MRLEQAKKEYSDSFDGLSNILAQQHKTETDEIIRTCQENLALYRELLEPVKMGVCQADDIWVPKSIGLLGRMSWINLYGDWLRILLDSVVGVGGHRNEKPAIDIKRFKSLIYIYIYLFFKKKERMSDILLPFHKIVQ